MNSLERLQATLRGLTPDRTPVITQAFGFAAVSAGIDLPLYYRGGAPLADAQLHTLRRFRSDAVFTFADGNVETEAMGGLIEFPSDSHPFPTDHPFSPMDNPERMRLPDPAADGRMPGILKATRLLHQAVGSTTPIIGLACGPLTLVSQWFGLETALMLAIDDLPRFQMFLHRAEEVGKAWGAAQLEAGAHLIYVFDPVASPDVIPAGFFREIEAPGLTRILVHWQAAGNLCRSLHITGPIEALLPHFDEMRVELANFDYEVDLLRIASTLPGLAINGNIRPLLFQESEPDTLLAECGNLTSALAHRGRFILSPGCEIPLGTRTENLLAFCSSVQRDSAALVQETDTRLTVFRSGSKTPLLESVAVDFGEPLVGALRRLGHPIVLGCAGLGNCRQCGIRVLSGRPPEPSAADLIQFSQGEIDQGHRLACQTYLHDSLVVELLEGIRSCSWQESPPNRIDLFPTRLRPPVDLQKPSANALVLDLGTSRLELSRINPKGHLDPVLAHPNPQSDFGADIVSRAEAATRHRSALDEMREALAATLHEGFLRMGIDPLDTSRSSTLTVVGNTVMLCLFAGQAVEATLDPENWTRPILPSFETSDPFWRERFPAVRFDLMIPLGGFIGSDLLAGILATGMTRSADPTLLVDFGTNSEVALWTGSTLWVASAAGGPAFEGCGLSHLLPATPGAIRNCMIDSSGHVDATTIGDAPPIGFCTTGVIDLVAACLEHGWIDARGNVIHRPELDLPFKWHLEKTDLDYLQRAKAGIGATIELLMDRASLRAERLTRVLLAGQIGEFASPESVRRLGLVPFVAPELIEGSPHLPLHGAALWAVSHDVRFESSRLASGARLVSPALENDFEDRFVEHLHLRPMEAFV